MFIADDAVYVVAPVPEMEPETMLVVASPMSK
jgi:hypothetical protein